ncbi:hypothetical protein [Shimia gijangensis]|nr:hypothetical protein [Shimia gijangensis]
MRYFIGIVLSLGFLLFGVVILGAGIETIDAKGMTEDAIAAPVFGGGLSLIGVVIFFAARGAHKKRKAGQKADYGEAGATILGMSMVSDSFDDDGGFDD